jgi:hypothetical protein
MMRWWLPLVLLCGTAAADEVTLKNGSKLTGIVRDSKDPNKIEMEIGVGVIRLDKKDVLSVEKGESPLQQYYEKWEQVKTSEKAADYLELARFAKENNLPKFLRSLYEVVLRFDPENAEARKFLGFEKYQGKWMTRVEVNRAKGLVEFEGRWMTTAERELILSKRLESKLKREEELAERKRRKEEAERERRERAVEIQLMQQEQGYYYQPSIFWPGYYRGPRRAPRVWPGGYYDAVPTFDIFDVIPNPFKVNTKK